MGVLRTREDTAVVAASEGGPWMRGSWKTERAGRVCGGRLWGPSPTRCAGPARSQASDPGPQRGTRSAWWTPGGWAVTHLMRESDFAAKGRGETNLPRGRGSQRTAGTAQCGDRNEPPGERGSDGQSPGFWGKAEKYAPLTTSPQLWFLVLKRRTLDETHQWPLVRNRPLWPGVCQTRPVTRVDRPVYCPSQASPASRWARTRGPGSPDPSLGLYLWPPGDLSYHQSTEELEGQSAVRQPLNFSGFPVEGDRSPGRNLVL